MTAKVSLIHFANALAALVLLAAPVMPYHNVWLIPAVGTVALLVLLASREAGLSGPALLQRSWSMGFLAWVSLGGVAMAALWGADYSSLGLMIFGFALLPAVVLIWWIRMVMMNISEDRELEQSSNSQTREELEEELRKLIRSQAKRR